VESLIFRVGKHSFRITSNQVRHINDRISLCNRTRKFDDPNSCWIWDGRLDSRGYPTISYKSLLVQRLSWLLYWSQWDKSLSLSPEDNIHHRCENKLCVNPTHLKKFNSSRSHIAIGHRNKVKIFEEQMIKDIYSPN
jgi:hypothetical protein